MTVTGQVVLNLLKALWFFKRSRVTHTLTQCHYHKKTWIFKKCLTAEISAPKTNNLHIFYTPQTILMWCCRFLLHGHTPSPSNTVCHVCNTGLHFLQALLLSCQLILLFTRFVSQAESHVFTNCTNHPDSTVNSQLMQNSHIPLIKSQNIIINTHH
jgi:hypothetical protein